ncbi:MutS-related protein [Pontibacter chitinilyticus]|uniref:MutS-related protein n=1 Tax=Pontibacter chitinilyticus TaxID=2674989 RepID=UPI00321A00C1
MSEIREQFYQQRAAQFAEQEKGAASRSSTVSWLRVLVFLAGAALAYYCFRSGQNALGGLAILVFYILFLVVLRWHQRLDFKHQQLVLLQQFNLQEVDRLHGRLRGFDEGSEFADAHHPYTSDLDIFGANSLFQLLNRAVSSIGRQRLASWLQQAATPATIQQRQEALQELTQHMEWTQVFLVLPRYYKQTAAPATEFITWMRQHTDFYLRHPFMKVLVWVLPVLTLAAIVAWGYGVSGYVPSFFLLVQYLLGYKYNAEREAYYEKSIGMYEAVRSYSRQLQHLEQHTFSSPLLQQLQAALLTGDGKASAAVTRLSSIIDYFSWRLSTLMSFFLNTIFMWDFIWMFRLEQWRQKHLEQLEKAVEVLAETEALASMACFRHANPGFAMPQLSEQSFTFKAQALAHPLIFSVAPVTNSFGMAGMGQTIVITGSNMSGKTTFLRTIGINMVLALMGAPACAEKLILAPAQVYTAMRTVDNLAENTSSFYAELKRLRVLLELTEQGQPVFYLLDEILKGTNSRDRHHGAMALIRQLHKRNAAGLISTHDLELGAMEQELLGSVHNYSFNSDIVGNEIRFDYKLRRGICRSFNASKLMELMGIDMNNQPEDNKTYESRS